MEHGPLLSLQPLTRCHRLNTVSCSVFSPFVLSFFVSLSCLCSSSSPLASSSSAASACSSSSSSSASYSSSGPSSTRGRGYNVSAGLKLVLIRSVRTPPLHPILPCISQHPTPLSPKLLSRLLSYRRRFPRLFHDRRASIRSRDPFDTRADVCYAAALFPPPCGPVISADTDIPVRPGEPASGSRRDHANPEPSCSLSFDDDYRSARFPDGIRFFGGRETSRIDCGHLRFPVARNRLVADYA